MKTRRKRPLPLQVGVATCAAAAMGTVGGAGVVPSAKTISVNTPLGTATLSMSGKLPTGWPASFPVPPGGKVAGSGKIAGKSKSVSVGVYTSSKSPKQVYNFYKTNSSLTVTRANSFGLGSAFAGSLQVSKPFSGSITVLGRGNQTLVVGVVKKK
jgi:hypothetical protein